MRLPTKDGIICDLCGVSFRNVFTYYSINGSSVKVDEVNKVVFPPVPNNKLDLDICETCYEKLKSRCLNIIEKNGNQMPQRHCEQCNTKMQSGVYSYTLMILDRVDVDRGAENATDVLNKAMDYKVCQQCTSDMIEVSVKTKKSFYEKDNWS